MPNSVLSPKAGRREWLGLAVIALPCLVYAMDLTLLNLALPAISAQLAPTSSQLLWIVDIYGFMVAGFLITMGTLGDRIGRRRLLLIGAAAFGLASTLASFSDSAPMLIATRALLGIAGATLAPSTMSLIRTMFHDEAQRRFAIGVWIASFSLGGVIGPLAGGLVLQFFSWSAVFLLAVPVMVLLLLLGPALLPEARDPDAGAIDLVSVAQSLLSILTLIYGIKELAQHGWDGAPVLCVAIGLALGVAFVRRQGRLAYPLLDIAMLRQRHFSAALVAYGLACLALFGAYIFVTQKLQLVMGLPPLQAGLATLPLALGFMAGALLASLLARHASSSAILIGGLLLAAIGFGLLALADNSHVAMVCVALGLAGLGLGPVFTVSNEMMIASAPPERAGAASAILETASEFSAALGIAVFGSVGTALYRADLSNTLPMGVTPEVASAAMATLGGALAAARALPEPVAAALAGASKSAFSGTVQVIAALSALILVATAMVFARCLGGRKQES